MGYVKYCSLAQWAGYLGTRVCLFFPRSGGVETHRHKQKGRETDKKRMQFFLPGAAAVVSCDGWFRVRVVLGRLLFA